MKSLTQLWNHLSIDMERLCGTSAIRDRKTVADRVEHEGLSFLTITLTNFGSDLQKGLEQGFVDRQLFQGFNWKGGLPRFLGGFLDLVFNRCDGRLLENPDGLAIFAIRQLTLVFGKIELECSDARKLSAIRKYLECEQDVKRFDRSFPEMELEFSGMSNLLFRDVLTSIDRKVYEGELVPKHGPGATADRLRGNAKFDQLEWTQRLEGLFPYGEYALPNWRYYYLLDRVDILEPRDERPVRVIFVPKTLKTPRVIAIEPTCMQYMQQALLTAIVPELEGDPLLSELIGFTDQTPNQRMAREGSEGQGLATIDLSEASDRVSNQHVRAMLGRYPSLKEGIDSCRSRKADVPGHGVIRLAKFASMGSAVCFPMEAMVFLTIVFLGIQDQRKRRLSRGDIKSYARKVRVYGDDIVVPTDTLPYVIARLEAFGLRVNSDKTFGSGKFRESCGRDYYDGLDVTPVRVRHPLPSSRKSSVEAIAAVALRNNLYEAGLWHTAAWMDSWLVDLFGGHFPTVSSTSPVLGRWSRFDWEIQRLDPYTHSPQVKGYVVSTTPPRSLASGEGALLKWFLKPGDEPFVDRDHLERTGRPDAVYTKLRWANVV